MQATPFRKCFNKASQIAKLRPQGITESYPPEAFNLTRYFTWLPGHASHPGGPADPAHRGVGQEMMICRKHPGRASAELISSRLPRKKVPGKMSKGLRLASEYGYVRNERSHRSEEVPASSGA